ncbi:SDR family NAD(P)-dependent oxidoreductase [Microbulbifer rhizosphaerae]|uniref:NAD(P)-dependent dehydrogenase (Short-subunit alcohol dehydrogenase family) n=1 Tax=Microbulbifer rhizosphaerae TaxID=1562603 RepID=A0A7W4ZB77_9GAMM|nr:SDR family oxidoreductase [Microbulbifer rhizosphaerae]MBB3063553.1 NAD(P)-dependent dehydrogenase (short-subunit alcohol dehydrogenase family) [Microbulbifer rhizosphaerae]
MAVTTYSDLKDTSVFITGGGSGIGAAFVRAFVAQGARVAFVSLDADKAERLCDDIEAQSGVRPFYRSCDISDVDHLKACVAESVQEIGPIDVLINNAARDTRHTLDEFTPEDWDQSINTNLRPHFFTAQAVAAGMREKGLGSIINVGSNSSLLGLSGYPAYVTAKAAIIGLTKALARELGPDNIRVNALIPGWVMTERQKELWVTPEALQECLDQQCLKDTISEEDCANSALFLASLASRMITGQSLVIDGGRV